MYNLNRKLEELEVQGKSIKIAIIGAGHMGTGMVSQVVNMKGMIPSIVVDINVDLAKASFLKAGINVQISSTLDFAILAACSLPPVVINKCAPGYKTHRIINIIIDKKDFEYARGKVAYAYL